ncbi:regulatory protein cys-3 [Moniliophthora roreri MCA 2997]|uniref:Regulatory protein cys-3 n=1 Tax=Moniliophthora roreri (strain MCA 2997) TaxID=1381753 RepID=V2X6Z6_MONRO|nr:regulatory protein cys-3 [Moniliophthora roreri MCA 2997]
MKKNHNVEEDNEEKGGVVPYDSHVNVATGSETSHSEQAQQTHHSQQPPFDINTFLSGFGIDGFHQQMQVSQQQGIGMSVAQILALHSLTQGNRMQLSTTTPPANKSSGTDVSPPPAKRTRTRKGSESVVESPIEPFDPNVTAAAAAEDKRRRNTAASARFRLKKKEREIALENKAKELEIRVNELERECEALRRENGWLKGLVVGVTGAAQTNAQTTPNTGSMLVGAKGFREDTS